jgi:histidine triad (HIT) family protein
MKDVFCKIIDGEIPSTRVYEDEDVLAILDISQTTKGHTLVMPKKHCESMLTCPAEILNKVMLVAQRIGQAEIQILGAKGVNILANCGEAAGQTVPHFHVHVIPRYLGGEGGFRLAMEAQDTSKMNLPMLAKEIADALN